MSRKLIEKTALVVGAIATSVTLIGLFATIHGLLFLIGSHLLGWPPSVSALLQVSTAAMIGGFWVASLAGVVYNAIDNESQPAPKANICRQCGACKYFNAQSSSYLWCAAHPEGPKESRCRDYKSIL